MSKDVKNPAPSANGDRAKKQISSGSELYKDKHEFVIMVNDADLKTTQDTTIDPVRFPIIFTHWS